MAAQAQTVFYNAATTTAAAQTGAVHYMQSLSFAQGPGSYLLQSFQLGVAYSPATVDQGVIVEFYSGVDTTTTTTNALLNASYLGGVNGVLGAPGTAGNYTYTFTLNTPFTLNTDNLAVVFYLTNSALTNYSTALSGRFTTSAPTVGTAPGYVWNDANVDGLFAGAEQTRFGQNSAAVRFSATGIFTSATAVPEPASWAMMIAGFGLIGGVMRRRNVPRSILVI